MCVCPGERGQQGVQGVAGPPGTAGQRGEPGDAGEPGIDGDRGNSDHTFVVKCMTPVPSLLRAYILGLTGTRGQDGTAGTYVCV